MMEAPRPPRGRGVGVRARITARKSNSALIRCVAPPSPAGGRRESSRHPAVPRTTCNPSPSPAPRERGWGEGTHRDTQKQQRPHPVLCTTFSRRREKGVITPSGRSPHRLQSKPFSSKREKGVIAPSGSSPHHLQSKPLSRPAGEGSHRAIRQLPEPPAIQAPLPPSGRGVGVRAAATAWARPHAHAARRAPDPTESPPPSGHCHSW